MVVWALVNLLSTEGGMIAYRPKASKLMAEISHILQQFEAGDYQSSEELLVILYEELKKLAAALMARERVDHTLQPTALVHEAYIRLVGSNVQAWNSRGHFFAAAAEAMRRVLIDAARKRNAKKRSNLERVTLEVAFETEQRTSVDLFALDEALKALEASNPVIARLVTLRYFGGMTLVEASKYLGISLRSANSYWKYAKAFLKTELSCDG